MFTLETMADHRRHIISAALQLLNAHRTLVQDDYDDDEEERKRRKVPRVESYCENTVPSMSDRDFQRSFRLSRSTFDQLLHLLGPKITNTGRVSVGPMTLCVDKQLMVTLQMLANQEPYR